MIVKCLIDEHGIRRARVDSPYEMVGLFLEGDVQGSLYHCKLLLSIIEKVKSGIESFWSGTGNAYTITITRDKVVLEDEYSEPLETCEIPLFKFEKALTQWFQFIKSDQEDLSESFEVKDEKEKAQIRAHWLEQKLLGAKKRRARKSLSGV